VSFVSCNGFKAEILKRGMLFFRNRYLNLRNGKGLLISKNYFPLLPSPGVLGILHFLLQFKKNIHVLCKTYNL